jgi:L-alanine-DL-glutamate epimerase-like enolase superfamily enzyme
MKITSYKTRMITLPTDVGEHRRGTTEFPVNYVTLQVQTDEGIEGISYAGVIKDPYVPALKMVIDTMLDQAVAQGLDPFDGDALLALKDDAGSGSPAGLLTRSHSAIDVACWDLRGKALGKPVRHLLGSTKDRVPTYATGRLWRHHDLKTLAEIAPKIVEQGFTEVKVPLGGQATVADEVARYQVVKEAVGPDVRVSVDINQGWTVNQAITIGRKLEELGLFWLEDPVQFQDIDGMARIADALDVPICGGEYVYGLRPFLHMFERHAVDIVMVDIFRAGGITGFMQVAQVANAFGIPMVSHLSTEFLSQALSAVPLLQTVDHVNWTFPLFQEVPQVENGELILMSGPGFGMAFDEDALEHFDAG